MAIMMDRASIEAAIKHLDDLCGEAEKSANPRKAMAARITRKALPSYYRAHADEFDRGEASLDVMKNSVPLIANMMATAIGYAARYDGNRAVDLLEGMIDSIEAETLARIAAVMKTIETGEDDQFVRSTKVHKGDTDAKN